MADQYLGMKLKRHIFNESGLLVLASGTVLNRQHLEQLRHLGIDLESRDVEPAEPTPQQMIIERSVDLVKRIFEDIRHTRKLPMPEIEREVLPDIVELGGHWDVHHLLSSLKAKDLYTYRHNIAVGVISCMIGKWLNISEDAQRKLAMAGFLHDVGKMFIPEDILNKPGKLTEDEFELVKKHTVFGYELILNTIGPGVEATVALQHHERLDGTGYPHGIGGQEIHPMARIVSVADVFHAMSSYRSYKDAAPFCETLSDLENGKFGKLDPMLLHIFIERMMQSMVGKSVELTDHRIGTVVLVHPHDPLHPLIMTGEEFIDLKSNRSIQIRQVLAS